MARPILQVKNLNVSFDNEKIITNLSFDLNKGQVITILGPNGAGKTVLLKTLLGLNKYQGKIKWQSDIKIGYVPQRLPFIKDMPMSVAEFFKLKGIKSQQIKKIFTDVGFKKNILDKNIGTMSSGQFQRILIAWALVNEPDVLLFDEPTTGIDISGEETIYALLSKLQKQKNLTIILVTHDLSVVHKFSDYVICLNRSSVCQGRPKQTLTPQNLNKLYGEEVKFYQHLTD